MSESNTQENLKNVKLTLGEFRKITKHLPDDIPMTYHGYYKGCRLSGYAVGDLWLFPTGEPTRTVVLNPADDYDGRASRKIQ